MYQLIADTHQAIHADWRELMDLALRRPLNRATFFDQVVKSKGFADELLAAIRCTSKADFTQNEDLLCQASFFQGLPCFAVAGKGYGCAFALDRHANHILDFHGSQVRQDTAARLREDLTALLDSSDLKTAANKFSPTKAGALIKAYAKENLADLVANRIFISTLLLDRPFYDPISIRVDKSVMEPEIGIQVFTIDANMRLVEFDR